MQCRICFDNNNPEQMLTPCACTGTQAYIHYNCLTQYLRHYPDGICRVCRQQLQYIPRLERFLFLVMTIIVWSLWVITKSPINVKIFFVLAFGSVLTIYNVHHFTNLRFLLFLIGLNVLFMMTNHYFTNIYILVTMCTIATFHTLCLYVSPTQLLTVVTIVIVGMYTFLLGFAALTALDSYGVSLFVTVLFLLWNAFIQTHPPLR